MILLGFAACRLILIILLLSRNNEVVLMDYVVFDLAFLYQMANMIRSNVGVIFGVCFYLFLAVLSVYVIHYIIVSFVDRYLK